MSDTNAKSETECRLERADAARVREKIPAIVDRIIATCNDDQCRIHTHIDYEPIPSKQSVIEIIDHLREILFPGYFSREKIDPVNLTYTMGRTVSAVFDMLSEQICRGIRHECFRHELECSHCGERGNALALDFLESLPDIQKVLATDIQATFDGDPAAKSLDEIIFSYPGVYAVAVHRIARRLFELEVPLLPRIMSEHAHNVTGIDIHPGAEIGERFVIDHGTGVVIGESAVIGNNVRIYQGVTLGALSLPQNAGEALKGKKRHPTIEDDVIIYAGATILGGDTVIGARSVVGGNVWITESVPPDTTVVMEAPRLIYKNKRSPS